MDYDLYTNDDRLYAPVIQQDDGGSVSGSSYAGSDASHADGRFPAHDTESSESRRLSQPSAGVGAVDTSERDTEIHVTDAGIGVMPVNWRSQDPIVPTHQENGSQGSEMNQDVLDQEEDLISRNRFPSIIGDDGRSADDSIQAKTLPSHSREEVANPIPESYESEFEAGILSRSDGSQGILRNRKYGNLRSASDLQHNISASEGDTPVGEVGQAPGAGSSRKTTLLRESESSRHRPPLLERPGENNVRLNQEFVDIVLPRWQPDAEVTYCPICRTQFSFFVRKHHCRRCGRVVCNSCSPHRITIPYQFIVQPPPSIPNLSTATSSQFGSTMSSPITGTPSEFSDRNGGMKVRLCNPCVPDPNPLPPQPQYSDTNGQVPSLYLNSGSRPYSFAERSLTGNPGRARGLSAASGLRPDDRYSQHRSTSPYSRQTGSTAPSSDSASNVQSGHYQGHMPRADPLRVQGPSPPVSSSSHSPSSAHSSQSRGHSSRHQSLSFIPGSSTSNPQPHYRSLLDVGNDQYTRILASSNRPLPPVPQVNEEDECPVCHRVLFSRNLPDLENRRAAHIIQCIDEQIALHSGNSSRPRTYTTQSQYHTISNTPDHLTPPQEPAALLQPPLAAPMRTSARERAHTAVVFGTTPSASSTPPSRRTGMFIYRASEKDCVDDAECTICLEEFEVGASMARLECFCRFHKKCIQDWFVDHPGRCPVHQHDGYGF